MPTTNKYNFGAFDDVQTESEVKSDNKYDFGAFKDMPVKEKKNPESIMPIPEISRVEQADVSKVNQNIPVKEPNLPQDVEAKFNRFNENKQFRDTVLQSSETDTEKQLFNSMEDWYDSRSIMSPTRKIYELDKIKQEKGDISLEDINNLGLNYNNETGEIYLSENEKNLFQERYDWGVKMALQKKAEEEKNPFQKEVWIALNKSAGNFMGNMADISFFLTGSNLKKIKEFADKGYESADYWAEQSTRDNNEIIDLVAGGNMAGAVAESAVQLTEQLPMLVSLAMGNYAGYTNATLGLMGGSAYTNKYRELKDSDLPEFNKIFVSLMNGVNEIIWEKAGTVSILNDVSRAVKELGEEEAKKRIGSLYATKMESVLSAMYGGTSEAFKEGASEWATEFSNNLVDKAMVDPNTDLFQNTTNSFIIGMLVGKGLSLPVDVVNVKNYLSEKLNSLPEDFPVENKIKATELLVDRDRLKQQENKVDEAFKGEKVEDINKINEELKNLQNEKVTEQQTKTESKPETGQQEVLKDEPKTETKPVEEEQQTSAPEKNNFEYKGNDAYLGIVDTETGDIVNTYTYKQVEETGGGKHATYLGSKDKTMVDNGKFARFRVFSDGKVEGFIEKLPQDVKTKIEEQITKKEIVQPETKYEGYKGYSIEQLNTSLDEVNNSIAKLKSENPNEFKIDGTPKPKSEIKTQFDNLEKQKTEINDQINVLNEKGNIVEGKKIEPNKEVKAEEVRQEKISETSSEGKVIEQINIDEVKSIEQKLKKSSGTQKEYFEEDINDLKDNPKKYWNAFDLSIFEPKNKTEQERYDLIKKMQDNYKTTEEPKNAEEIRSNEGQVQEGRTILESSQNKGSENIQLNEKAGAKASDTKKTLEEEIKKTRKKELTDKEKEIKDRIAERLQKLSGSKFATGEESTNTVKEVFGLVNDLAELGLIKLEKGIDHVITELKKYLPGKDVDQFKQDIEDNFYGVENKSINPEYSETITKIDNVNKNTIDKKVKEAKSIEVKNKKEIKNKIHEYIIDRRGELNLAMLETNLYTEGLKKELSQTEREALPFIIEKTEVPEALGRKDLQDIVNNKNYKTKSGKLLTDVAKEVKEHFDKVWEDIVANTDKLTSEQIVDYVTHIWDIPKNKLSSVATWFSTKNKFLNKRYIQTYAEGIEKFGLKPKTLDISDIIRIHDNMSYTVIANKKFLDNLKSIEKDGLKIIQPQSKAPDGYVNLNHPALTIKKYIPQEEGADIIYTEPILVHPDAAKPLSVIFGHKLNDQAGIIKAYEMIGGILKKSQLSLSMFHHTALTETGIAFMGLPKTLKAFANIAYDAAKGNTPSFANKELAKDAAAHTLQFGATQDIPVKQIQTLVEKIDKFAHDNKIPGKSLTRLLSTFNEKWDKALWDYLHDGLKLYAYEDAVSNMPDKFQTSEEVKKYKIEMAQLINDTFGGQNWDMLMINPQTQQIMKWTLLSPDWTWSTIRQALSPFGIGNVYKSDKFWNTTKAQRAKKGVMFWAKAGIYFGIGMNLLNAFYRDKDEEENPELYKDELSKKDKWMSGNTIGHKSHLFIGRDDNGFERYLRWGKQFRELPELFENPFKKIGGKASPQLQLVSQIFTGRTLSGYENWDMKDKKGLDWIYGAAKTVAKSPLPFSSSNIFRDDKEWKPIDLFMPTSKGMSSSAAISYFKKGMVYNEETGEIDQDLDYITDIYEAAVRNNLDVIQAYKTAISSVKSERTRNLKEIFDSIEEAKKERAKAKNSADKMRIDRQIIKMQKKEKNLKESWDYLNKIEKEIIKREESDIKK